MSKRLLFILTLLLVITACGKKGNETNNIIEERYSSNPVFLESDNSYQFSNYNETLETFNFYARGNDWKEKRIFNESFSQFKIPFKDNNNIWFNEIFHGTHVKLIKKENKVSNIDVITDGFYLPLSNGKAIKEKTLQSVGLNVLYAFKKVDKRVKKVSFSIPNLKRVHFSLLPKIEEIKNVNKNLKKIFYHVNNASYSPMKNGEGIISFYPQSEEAIKAKEFGGVPLWEMPWVTGH